MNTSHCNDAQVSRPNDSGGKIAYDSRQQSRLRNPQPTSIGSSFDFKKPRFSERNSYPRIPLSVNRSKLRIPFKSELCMLFQRGRCYYGENCHYAHSVSEIGKAGFNTVATEEHLNDGSKRNDICAARECRWFSCGTICPYGDNCHYLHKIDQKVRRDVGFNRQRDAVSGVNGVIDRSGSAQIQCLSLNASEVFRKAAWKTKLCAKWEMFGNCHHEARCTYAHGIAELQEPGARSKLEHGYTSWSTPASQPYKAASCEVGKKTVKEPQVRGKRCLMEWDIEKMSQIYADWVNNQHNSDVLH